MTATAFRDLDISNLHESKWNPRKHWNETKLEELAASIREKGVIEPIVVRANADGFEILAGSRRYRAAKMAGLSTVPAVIREIDDVAALELAVIENGQREDVHPLDEAEGYQALLKAKNRGSAKGAYNVAIVAAKVGKSESYVYRRLRLLELDPPLQLALAEDRLSVAHAEKLLRLPVRLRAEASDPIKGVVWQQYHALLDERQSGAKWIPQRDDLRPLSELEVFIRTRSHFDPTSRDTRHFQEELAEQLEDAADPGPSDAIDTDDAVAASTSSLVELTLDPMARMKLRAGPNDTIPLTPSKWREVKGEKDRCPSTTRGVITHGGAARVLEVCVKRSCPKHFPVAKKKPAGKKATAAPARDTWKEEEAKRHAERKDWEALLPIAGRAFAAHIAKVKLNAALVRTLLSSLDLKQVENRYGVTLTDATAAHVLALNGVSTWSPSQFGADTKPYGWDFKAFEKQYRADVDAKGKAALKASREQLKKKGTAKAAAKKKGGK